LGKAAECKTNQDCPKDKINLLGNGQMTGMCVSQSAPSSSSIPSQSTKTCEIFAWCPVELFKLPEKGKPALLENTKDFTVLVKNSIEFPTFGDSYKRRNIMESATKEYLQNCIYNNKTEPYCPTFRIGDIVTGSGFKYEDVAKTGGVFGLKIKWFCSFDFGASIQQCRPKYSFSRLDNPNSYISPGFNFKYYYNKKVNY
jgi:P2X purinoceptor 4